jgi:hypothetical protein
MARGVKCKGVSLGPTNRTIYRLAISMNEFLRAWCLSNKSEDVIVRHEDINLPEVNLKSEV